MKWLKTSTTRDPLSLPAWRKVAMVITHSLASFLCNYTAGAHLIAFKPISMTYNVSIEAVANTIGIGILGLGVGPLLWSPLASPTGLGRRGCYLLAWSCYVPLLLWLCFAKSYNSFAAARFIICFFGAVAQSIPAQQIGETFDRRYKGTAISAWALLMTCGPVATPIVGAGLLKLDTSPEGWRSLYYFCTVFAALVWVLIVLFVPETAYVGPSTNKASNIASEKVHDDVPQHSIAGQSDDADKEKEAASLQLDTSVEDNQTASASKGHKIERVWWKQIPTPFSKFLDAPVFLCALTFAICFGWSVGLTILNPQVFELPPYSFDAVQIGGVYMSALIGAIFGKLLGGYIVDVSLLKWRARTNADGTPNRIYPEQRLWALLAFLPMGIIGLLCYAYGLADQMAWAVSVIPGQAFYYCFFNIISGILQTYCVEIEPRAGIHLISFLNFVKCTWAFGIPFYVPVWALPSPHAFKTSFIIQMIIMIALIALVCLMASLLRHGSLPHRNGRKPIPVRFDIGL